MSDNHLLIYYFFSVRSYPGRRLFSLYLEKFLIFLAKVYCWRKEWFVWLELHTQSTEMKERQQVYSDFHPCHRTCAIFCSQSSPGT